MILPCALYAKPIAFVCMQWQLRGFHTSLCAANRFNTTPVVLVGNKLDLACNSRAVSTDEASHAASTRHCAFAETSAKTSDIGQAIDAVLGQLLVIGFDVPLAASTTSSSPPADVDELGFKTGTGSVRARRGQGQGSRKKLGRSRSAGLMITTASSNQSPTNRGSPVISGSKVRLQQRHSTANQLTTGGSHVTDDELLNDQLQDSRCVILWIRSLSVFFFGFCDDADIQAMGEVNNLHCVWQ